MADITIELDLDNIEKGLADLDKLQREIDKAVDDAIEEIVDSLNVRLQDNLDKYGLGGSELAEKVTIKRSSDGVTISVDAEHAEYVEYGTGIVGEQNPHPHPWAYDVNGHGEDGWKYIGKDGKLHWTMGMPSRPFMYETWLYGTRIATNKVKKFLRRIKV